MKKKGFVVSAILYPLLVLFLALIMGMLSMTDTRKRILDRMKLEVEGSIFDDETCSCDTILNKLNYLIKNGVGGGASGSYAFNVLGLNVKVYEKVSDLPAVNNSIGDIAAISDLDMSSYYVSATVPPHPTNGMIWIVQDRTSQYYIESDWQRIGISYILQYEDEEWKIKPGYVYMKDGWKALNFVNLDSSDVDLSNSNIDVVREFSFKGSGEYQEFIAKFPGYYKIELWGAQGGTKYVGGGKGAYTSGRIYLDAGTTLYVYVGGTTSGTGGGWNGGGGSYTRGGGGATDVRLYPTITKTEWRDFESLKSRIMVAAGGSGESFYTRDESYHRAAGAAGGTLTGISGTTGWNARWYGTGGTQSTGGAATTGIACSIGGFGYGGTAGSNSYSSGSGGGGGWYGGGGADAISSGGGGSSYISGHDGCSSIAEDSISTNIIHTGSKYHYSKYYFIDTEMIAGDSKMVAYDGKSYMVGNSGNGHAKITLTSIEHRSEEEIEEIKEKDETYHYYYSGLTRTNGLYQTFKAQKNGYYQVDAYGAQGHSSYYAGGKGAHTEGEIYLNKGEVLYLYPGASANGNSGGWNGGGNGYTGGGGGASDVRLATSSSWKDFESLKTRIMVAAGGSGGSFYTGDESYHRAGGAAGGTLTGPTGPSGWNGDYSGTGAIQTIGGRSLYGNNATIGRFGYAGNAGTTSYSSGSGGGGGYYGGGGADGISSGGGGSSYISGYEKCNSIDKTSTEDSIIHTGSKYHYSGKYFINSSMEGNNNSGDGKIVIKLSRATTLQDDEVITLRKQNNINFYYSYSVSGNYRVSMYQLFTADKTGTYNIQLWGAQGASIYTNGGKGGYVFGNIYLQENTKLYVFVGEQPTSTSGGWNGGGNGYSGGGGGATDIRIRAVGALNNWNNPDSLKSRIMVAGAGSGASYYTRDHSSHRAVGAEAGGFVGYDGTTGWTAGYNGRGGKQYEGGIAVTNAANTKGGFGYGGNAGTNSYSSGSGGGSGWYGGGGGDAISSGAGGSSYISGYPGCIGIDSTGAPLNTTFTNINDSISYLTYTFTSATLIDGKGYTWEDGKEKYYTEMPTQDGSNTMLGNTGHGYAKITYVGA